MTMQAHAFARAGLVGNPSDGYFGKTISFIIRNFRATVTLEESDHFEIVPTLSDLCVHDDVASFLRDQKLFGYHGGLRLLKASVKKFVECCEQNQKPIDPTAKFKLSYTSDIPRLVGLSGSSALVIATLRALMQFFNVSISPVKLATLALDVESDLGITAGLQDRVIQSYEGIVYMDFDRQHVEQFGYGKYEPIHPSPMPPLYVAFDADRAEISDVPHRNLRQLWMQNDPTVLDAINQLASITDRVKIALDRSDWIELGKCIDENYGVRQRIMNIAPENHRMVTTARSVGCSAHFSGSGGAICGLCDESHWNELKRAMTTIGCTLIRPTVFE